MKAASGASARNLLGPLVRSAFRIRVTGSFHLPTHGGVLILSTREGIVEPTLLATCLTRPVSVLVDPGLAALSWRASLGRIVVDPQRPHAALVEARSRLRAGQAVAMFPGGGPSEEPAAHHTDGFASGTAYLQAAADVPVVPVAIVGARGRRPTDPPPARALISIVVGAPVTPGPLVDPLNHAALLGRAEELRQAYTDHVGESKARAGAAREAWPDRHNGLL